MDINQLRGFLTVAKEKGFSKAAKILFKTQSTVSIQVKALEDELGVKLLDRINPRKTELTKEGLLFLELALNVVEDFDYLIDRFNQKRGNIKGGEIRIATHAPVIASLLPETLRLMKKKYPDIKVTLLQKEKADVLSSIQNGEADLGISYLKKVPPSVKYEVIAKHDRVLVAPRGHPLTKKREITPKDIAEYPLVLPPVGSSIRKTVDEIFKKHGIDYNVSLEVSGRESIKKYIELGFGISIFNDPLLSREDRKKFHTVSISKYFGQSERGIIRRKRQDIPDFLEYFIQTLKSFSNRAQFLENE